MDFLPTAFLAGLHYFHLSKNLFLSATTRREPKSVSIGQVLVNTNRRYYITIYH